VAAGIYLEAIQSETQRVMHGASHRRQMPYNAKGQRPGIEGAFGNIEQGSSRRSALDRWRRMKQENPRKVKTRIAFK